MGKEPDFLGLGGYASSGSDAASSETSSSDHSDERSLDSAEIRAAEAQQRVKDFGEADSQYRATSALPSALDAFQEVNGRPAFLDPEATRPLAVNAMHGLAAAAAGAGGGQGRGPRGYAAASKDFDVSLLAPKVKGQQQQQADKRGPSGAVIEGKAKRYKQEDGPEATQQYTPAQIAMMGGNVDQLLQQEGKAQRGPATKPMPVNEFLDKGLGGAQLPRKQQDRKEKEKKKRAAGQSTHSQWKSEAEMVLRQQFD